jgi:sortase A
MIRLNRYHWLAALGLMLVYNGILGMSDALHPIPALPSEINEQSAPTTTPPPTFVDADPPEFDPPAELITLSNPSFPPPEPTAISISPAKTAAARLSASFTATPTRSVSDLFPDLPVRATPNPSTLAEEPIRLVISAISLDAPVVPAKMRTIIFRGEKYQQWLAPEFHAAGWHTDSARLGAIGNTVLSGHHNTLGAVFGRLVELETGDLIQVYSHGYRFVYQVTNRMIVPEKYQLLDTRMANVQWILPSQDERLTLITCWPNESNTHRVIIVAAPVERLDIATDLQ